MEPIVQGMAPMNLDYFRRKLVEKQREMESDLAAFEDEAKATGDAEVRDFIDDATISQGVSEAFEEGTIASQTRAQVADALKRMDAGTFGKCEACGRQIERARLEAIPWTPCCLEDQEKEDQRVPRQHEGATL